MNAKSITKNELITLNNELATENAALRAKVSELETQVAANKGRAGQSAASPCKECAYESFKEATDNARRLAKWAAEQCPGKYVISQIGTRVVCKLRAGYQAARAA